MRSPGEPAQVTRSELARAQERAERVYPKSTAFQGAYVKGARAKLAGRPVGSCPYKRDSRNTWRTAWRLAWIRGYNSVFVGYEDEA
jgi:ribosome modulation factor